MGLSETLINNSQCESLLNVTGGLSYNFSQTEALTAVKNDLGQRASWLDGYLEKFLDDTTFTTFTEVLIDDGVRPEHITTTYWEYEDFIKGRVKITEDQLIRVTDAFRPMMRNGTTGQYKDFYHYCSVTPLVETTSGEVMASKMSLAMYGPGPGEGSASLEILFSPLGALYTIKPIMWNSTTTGYYANEGYLLVSVYLPDPHAEDVEGISGYYALRMMPTDAQLHDSSANEYVSWVDIPKLLLGNSDIYTAMTTAIDAVLKGVTSVSDFVSTMKVTFSSVSDNVQQVINNFVATGLTISGVCGCLKRMLSDASPTTAEDDYHFTFTDNSIYTPKILLSSLVATTATAIGSVLAIVGGTVTKIIGVIALVVGGIAKIITQAFSIADQRYVSFNQKAKFNGFAPGYLQLSIPGSRLSNIMIEYVKMYGAIIYKYIGGDYILFIKDVAYTASGDVDFIGSTYGVELHITCDVPFSTSALNYLRAVYDTSTSTLTVPSQQSLRNKWEELVSEVDVYRAASNVVADANDLEAADSLMREYWLVNAAFAFLFILSGNSFTTTINMTDSKWSSSFINCGRLIFVALQPNATLPSWKNIMDPLNVGGALFGSNFNNTRVRSNFKSLDTCTETIIVDNVSVQVKDAVVNAVESSELWIEDYFFSSLDGEVSFSVTPPQYDASTFWLSLIAYSVIVVAVAAVAVVGTLKLRNTVKAIQAKRKASAESAWNAYTANPSTENFSNYRSAVRRNNLIAKFTGGSKLSGSGFWEDPSASDDSSFSIMSMVGRLTDDGTNEAASLGDVLSAINALYTSVHSLITGEDN